VPVDKMKKQQNRRRQWSITSLKRLPWKFYFANIPKIIAEIRVNAAAG